jgi:hypothetical protein
MEIVTNNLMRIKTFFFLSLLIYGNLFGQHQIDNTAKDFDQHEWYREYFKLT